MAKDFPDIPEAPLDPINDGIVVPVTPEDVKEENNKKD